MNSSIYAARSKEFLEIVMEKLEAADESGVLEAELAGGILTIEFENGRQLVVSCHAPSEQIWLASPISGGLHFAGADDFTRWQLPDGRELNAVLRAEIRQFTGLDIAL